MKTLLKAAAISFLLMLVGCAFEPAQPIRMPTDAEIEQYNASVDPEDRIVCRNETPVGSNIPKRTCRRVIDMEEDSLFVRQELIRAIR